MFLPFLIYFLCKGNLDAFITEYFCNTYSTVSKPFGEMTMSYLQGWIHMKKPFALFLIGLVLFCRKLKVSYGFLFGYFTFLSLAVIAPYPHYWGVLLPFSIFLFVLLVKCVESKVRLDVGRTLAASAVALVAGICFNIHTDFTFVFQKTPYRQDYYDISWLMAQTPKPKIMFNNYENGMGILAGSLPACKYWARQVGAIPAMDKNRREALLARVPDFVINSEYVKPQDAFTEKELLQLGYVCCGKAMGVSVENKVYCKKELFHKLPHVTFRTIDLLLKRNLLVK